MPYCSIPPYSLLRPRLGLIIVGLVLVGCACVYGVSGPYAARQLQQALVSTTHPSILNQYPLNQPIPYPLLSSLARHLPTPVALPPPWQGVGRRYLRHVWPQVAQQAQPLTLLQLIAQQPHQAPRVGYRRGLKQYVLNVGAVGQSVWIVLQREGVWTWQVQDVCSPRPHPSLELKRCPSDSR
ncbi:MAG: hypothetical protein RLY58_1529 [Pseudomonadota bacterium]|jgi:hypothetical protein